MGLFENLLLFILRFLSQLAFLLIWPSLSRDSSYVVILLNLPGLLGEVSKAATGQHN